MKHMTFTYIVLGGLAVIAVLATLGFTKLPFKFKKHPLLYPISETNTPLTKPMILQLLEQELQVQWP